MKSSFGPKKNQGKTYSQSRPPFKNKFKTQRSEENNNFGDEDPSAHPGVIFRYHRHLIEKVIEALEAIFVGGFKSDKVIERNLKMQKKWGSRDRKFFAETVYEITRHARRLAAMVNVPDECFRGLETFERVDFWRMWAAYLWTQEKPIPPWDEIDRIEFEKVPENAPLRVLQSYGDEFDEIGQAEWGVKWPSMAAALNEPANVYLRVNPLRIQPVALIEKLREEGISAHLVEEMTIKLTERKNVFTTQSFREGLFEVQDLSSQRVGLFLNPQPKDRVVDACAGAGGKSLHLAVLMQNKGKILALDVKDQKLHELVLRARRQKVDIIETRLIDSTKVIKRLHGTADKLLLDVPCTGSGVVRRNPDAKWRINRKILAELQQTQEDILNQYSEILKPGGIMVYATCSIFSSENEKQVQKFMKNNPDWKLLEERFCDPRQKDWDGFYMARLQKP